MIYFKNCNLFIIFVMMKSIYYALNSLAYIFSDIHILTISTDNSDLLLT